MLRKNKGTQKANHKKIKNKKNTIQWAKEPKYLSNEDI